MKRETKPLQAHVEVNDRMKEINSLQRDVEDAIRDIDERISYSKSNNQRVKVAAFNNERKKLVSLSSELYNKQLKELLRAIKNDKGYGGDTLILSLSLSGKNVMPLVLSPLLIMTPSILFSSSSSIPFNLTPASIVLPYIAST